MADAKVAFQSTLLEKAIGISHGDARECYHCAASHPELKRTFQVTIETRLFLHDSAHNLRCARMAELGLSTAPVQGAWWHAGRYPSTRDGKRIMDGKPVVARHLGAEGHGHRGRPMAIEPTTFACIAGLCVHVSAIPSVLRRHGSFRNGWSQRAVEGVDFTIDSLIELWTATNCRIVTRGEHQRGVNGLRLRTRDVLTRRGDLLISLATGTGLR